MKAKLTPILEVAVKVFFKEIEKDKRSFLAVISTDMDILNGAMSSLVGTIYQKLEVDHKGKEQELIKRIEELEKIIDLATVIGWHPDGLPEEKNMIVLAVVDKVRANLKKAYPLKIVEDAIAAHKKEEEEKS